MDVFGALLMLVAIVVWIIGIIKPSKVLRWRQKVTRLRVTGYSAILFFTGFLLVGIFAEQPENLDIESDKNIVQEEVNTNKEVNTDKEKELAQEDQTELEQDNTVIVPVATSSSNKEKTSKTDNKPEEKPGNVPDNAIPAKVTSVIDGDTIKVIVQGKEETVRMILVDTPETKHPDKPVEPFGPEASEFTTKTLDGKDVYLELDVQERDQYGRLLAYVWIGGKLFNKMLLEKGLARVAVYPPNVKYVDEFRAAQKQAQEKGIGIWSIENYAQDEKKQNTSKQTAKKTETNKKTETKKESSSSKTTKQQAAPKDNARCADPKIKGNINSKGEKIYHVPGGAYYDRTIPEAWFCTEEEAKAAGFRPSKR